MSIIHDQAEMTLEAPVMLSPESERETRYAALGTSPGETWPPSATALVTDSSEACAARGESRHREISSRFLRCDMANFPSRKDCIPTTHSGCLPRQLALIDQVLAKAAPTYDPIRQETQISGAVEACVRKQAQSGISIVADGEQRTSFALYLQDRLSGLEPRPGQDFPGYKKKFGLFLEDFERCLQKAVRRGATITKVPMTCAGPIEYIGQSELQRDLDNLMSATAKVDCEGAFMASIAPGAIESNEYYPSEQAFREAAGEALRTEYKAIVAAGFLLQIDDPLLAALFADPELGEDEAERRAREYVEVLNHSLRGIPEEKIRYRVSCDSARNSSPAPLRFLEMAKHMLRVNAIAYSFDASTVRHEDDAELWRTVRFPAGKVLVPGLINCANPDVEDPATLSERIVGFANRVGREGVVPSADNRIQMPASVGSAAHPSSIWAKFEALHEGAQRASRRLWRSYPTTAAISAA